MLARIGTLLGGGMKQSRSTGAKDHFVAKLDLDQELDASVEADAIPVGFLAHWVEISPNNPRHAVLFEKHGPGCCYVDLVAGEVLQTITTRPERQFYGHGAFSPDGSLLYATETDLQDEYKGYIQIRDGHDFRPLGEFPSFGLAPHDCLLVDGGKTLVISNGGSVLGRNNGPNVAYIDVSSESLLDRAEIPHERINAGHLALTSRGDLAVVSAPRAGIEEPSKHRGGISLRPAGKQLHTITEPEDVTSLMLGETLSVAIHEPSGTVAATNPEGQIVTFWRMDSGELIKFLRVPNPRGMSMSLDGDEFILTFGKTGKVSRISAKTLQPVDVPGNRAGFQCGATGSHILMYDLQAA